MADCCPDTALGNLVAPASTPLKGVVEELANGMRTYVTGGPSKTAVIVAYDIFGFDAGRVKQICDTLAAEGHLVVLPDFFRGDTVEQGTARGEERMAWIKSKSDPAPLVSAFNDTLMPFLESRGVSQVAVMGWCWGAWFALKAGATGRVVAAVAPHPSHTKLAAAFGEQEDEVLAAMQCPLLLLPASDDPESTKSGGANERVLRAKGLECEAFEFPEMKHGFISRGDIATPAVARDVQLAMEQAVAFLNKHLKPGAAGESRPAKGAKDEELEAANEARLTRQIAPIIFGNVISGAMLFTARTRLASEMFATAPEVTIFLTRLISAGAFNEMLLNPIIGKLSDSLGRKAVMPLGNLSVCLTRMVIFANPTKAWALVLEQLLTVPLTTSFFTAWRAACSDQLEGTKYAQFQAKMGMCAGLAVIIGPLLGKLIMNRTGDAKYCFLASTFVSAMCIAGIGANFTETLPIHQRKPLENMLADMQPLSFLQVMRASPQLNKLMWSTGFQTATEGRNLHDLVNVYLSRDLGWDWNQINNFVGGFGIALVFSGLSAKAMVEQFGLRRFASLSNYSNFAGQYCFSCPPPLNLFMSASAAMWIGMFVAAPGGRKRDAAEALIMKFGTDAGFGRGFLVGAQNNWRAVVNIICPLLFGQLYAWLSRRGNTRPIFVITGLTIILAELIFRSMSDDELKLDKAGRLKKD